MRYIKVILFSILIIGLLNSCSFIRRIFGGGKPRKEQTYIAQEHDNNLPVKKSPETIRLEALSHWNTGLVNQKQYNQTKNIDYAKIAIEKYEKYYALQPNGTYAGSALIRMAELAYYIGDKNRALFELNRIKRRYDLRNNYSEEIKLLEELLNQ